MASLAAEAQARPASAPIHASARTQGGGACVKRGSAVLWYLQKSNSAWPGAQTVQPRATSASSSVSHTSPSEHAALAISGASTSASSQASARPHAAKAAVPQQRDFLHGVLQAIGVEIDVGAGAPRKHASRDLRQIMRDAPDPYLPGARRPNSARHCQLLRQSYGTHVDAECEQLMEAIEAREAELEKLQQQAANLEKAAERTRQAAHHRTQRLIDEQLDEKRGSSESRKSARSQLLRSGTLAKVLTMKRNMLATVGGDIRDVDVVHKGLDDEEERIQKKIETSMLNLQAVREHITNTLQTVQARDMQIRADEALLLSAKTSTLELRAKTLLMEDRAATLGRELKRVLQHLPVAIRQRLEQAAPGIATKRQDELGTLRQKHVAETFRFMDKQVLEEKTGLQDEHIRKYTVACEDIVSVMHQGRDEVALSLAKAAELKNLVTHSFALVTELWEELAQRDAYLANVASQGQNDYSTFLFRMNQKDKKNTLARNLEEVKSAVNIHIFHAQTLSQQAQQAIVSLENLLRRTSSDEDLSKSMRVRSQISAKPTRGRARRNAALASLPTFTVDADSHRTSHLPGLFPRPQRTARFDSVQESEDEEGSDDGRQTE